jgi:apolipoprotein N-acyltransferase
MRSVQTDKGRFALAVLSGLILTGAFPNLDLPWLAWIALIPLFFAVRGLGLKKGFAVGFSAGMAHYLSLIYWIAYTMRTYGYLPWPVCVSILILLTAYLALYYGIFAMLVTRLNPNPFIQWLAVPAIWVALEFIRGFLFSGFPWEFLGYSQYTTLHLIQISDILGVYGISFLIVLVNTALFVLGAELKRYVDRARAKMGFIPAVVVVLLSAAAVAGTWSYGDRRLKTVDGWMESAPTLQTAVVQGNIEQSVKWDPAFQAQTVDKYLGLSRAVSRERRPDLIVWPETALPFYFLYDQKLSKRVIQGIRSIGTYFLVGSPSFTQRSDRIDYYNSAYLISPEGAPLGKYDKSHLVPFGEYVPLKRWLPFLGKIVAQVGDFSRGRIGSTLDWPHGKLGVLICYEVIFPYISKATVENGATLLINITNDAWYGQSSAPYQHYSMAVFRSVENRRALIRAANTGISGFIDPAGRVLTATALFEDATAARRVPLLKIRTTYNRIGDVFAMGCLAAAFLLIVGSEIGRRLTRKQH